MDKKLLKKHNLYEAHKHFMRLCEWSYVPSLTNEDDDEVMPQDNNAQEPQDNPMGGQNGDMKNNMPTDMGNQPMDNNAPMSDPNMTQDPNAQMQDVPQENPNMGNEMPQMDDMGTQEMGEEDEVIDVDDLTDAQEELNDKVNVVGRGLGDVDSKIETLLQALNKMEDMINNNNQEIANFKQEFEKRNPTETEKLNLRSLDSYPFNVSPKEYWSQKEAELGSNYSAYGDNDESTTQEYKITNSDVDDFNEREIENSFDTSEFEQNIQKIFGL